MAISGIHSSQNVYTENAVQTNPPQTGQPEKLEPEDCFSFKVEISDTAKMLFKKYDIKPSQPYVYPEWSDKWLSDKNLKNFDGRLGSINDQIDRLNSMDPETKIELKQYHHSIQNHISTEFKNHSIENIEDYENVFLQDTELSEQVHQAVVKRIADDPGTMELMESLGISLEQ